MKDASPYRIRGFWLWVVITLWVLFFAALLRGDTAETSSMRITQWGDACTDPVWYQRDMDKGWTSRSDMPNGRRFDATGSDHTLSYSVDGFLFSIINQLGTIAYKRPPIGTSGDSVGDFAAALAWDRCYTPFGDPPRPSCPRNRPAQVPPSPAFYRVYYLGQIPQPFRDIYGRAMQCNGPPVTPNVGTPTKLPTLPIKTATMRPTSPPCDTIPGGPICTRTPSPNPTRTAVRSTPPPTSTMVPPTPVPASTAPPRSTASPAPSPPPPSQTRISTRPSATPSRKPSGGCGGRGGVTLGTIVALTFVSRGRILGSSKKGGRR